MPRPPGAPRFAGFVTPRYTPVPDTLFDELLPDLSGAELKVLLYVMRRTMGFKKDSDTISLGQICAGITTREGRRLDRGTGLSRSTAVAAIRSLEEWGMIVCVRNRSEARGLEATTYHLRFVDPSSIIEPGYAENRTRAGSVTVPPLVRKSDPQETVEQETEQQETDLFDSTGHPLISVSERDAGVISAVVADFGRELGDHEHERSNITRAVNLWARSGLRRDEFVALAYEAKRLTRLYQGKQPPGRRIESKGAYFFAVLEGIVERKGTHGAGRDPPRRLFPDIAGSAKRPPIRHRDKGEPR